MWFQQLAGSHGILVALLALPILQQGLEHMQAVVYSPRAEQGCCCGTRDEGRRLGREKGGLVNQCEIQLGAEVETHSQQS